MLFAVAPGGEPRFYCWLDESPAVTSYGYPNLSQARLIRTPLDRHRLSRDTVETAEDTENAEEPPKSWASFSSRLRSLLGVAGGLGGQSKLQRPFFCGHFSRSDRVASFHHAHYFVSRPGPEVESRDCHP